MAAVKKAANNAACKVYLLVGTDAANDGTRPPTKDPKDCPAVKTAPTGFPNDWQVLVDQAIASNVCNQPGDKRQVQSAGPVT